MVNASSARCSTNIANCAAICELARPMLKVRVMKPWLRIFSVLWCVAVLFVDSHAQAQSVGINDQGFRVRRLHDRRTDQEPDAVSRKDCLDDDPAEALFDPATNQGSRTYLEFAVEIRDYASRDVLEIWASRNSDCTDRDERQFGGNCRRVYRSGRLAGFVHEAKVFPRVVIGRSDVMEFQAADTDEIGSGTAAYPDASVCNTRIDDQYTFYILLFDSEQIRTSAKWDGTRVDTSAPPAPDTLAATPGEDNVFLKWDVPAENEEPDADGFAFYCVPTGTFPEEEPASPSGGATGVGASGGEPGGGGDPGVGGTTGIGGTTGVGGATGVGGTLGVGGDVASGGLNEQEPIGLAGATGNPDCEQGVLFAGRLPSGLAENSYRCGGVRGPSTREGQASGRENGVTYAVAVASRDTLDNRGELSLIACATPQEVTTFYERYKGAGGRGGGLCGLALDTRPSSLLLLWVLGGVLLIARRNGRSAS